MEQIKINTTLEDLVINPQSMTKSLKRIDPNLTITVLKSGIRSNIDSVDHYERNIVLNVKQVPVLIATSNTKITNSMFLDIIKNSGDSPIGNKLFDPNSFIKRDPKMQIAQINVDQIENMILRNYLLYLDYSKKSVLIERQSNFYYNQETMQLIEYILPTIKQFIY